MQTLNKLVILVAVAFCANLVFGLPVDVTTTPAAESSAEYNSTNGTHKEL